ncbi:hypothetical protein V6N12_064654 [Hibiscus sabdariffa]|uniref:Uncharacterized protein n=1 Tax=Hibiscus sabdariffa TaxID=183260 RepID=A0ABR2G6H1_9ROSI
MVGKRRVNYNYHPNLFKFDAAWVLDESCAKIISDFWSSHLGDLPTKLDDLGLALKYWSRTTKQSQRAMKENLEARLQETEEEDPDDDTLEELINVKIGLNIEADLFTASDFGDASPIFENVRQSVTPAMNDLLSAPFGKEEV